jgi:hypothetical protein
MTTDADAEFEVAARAREGAQRAHSQADRWRRYLQEKGA